ESPGIHTIHSRRVFLPLFSPPHQPVKLMFWFPTIRPSRLLSVERHDARKSRYLATLVVCVASLRFLVMAALVHLIRRLKNMCVSAPAFTFPANFAATEVEQPGLIQRMIEAGQHPGEQ
ncbi:unnamed protein product, partial [Ectocarpus sp. 6 AP-2014]